MLHLRPFQGPGARAPGLAVLLLALTTGLLRADGPQLPRAFEKPVPESLQDLKDIQQHVRKTVSRLIPCTVGLRIGQSQGSGVIINREGYVLTAGHVSGEAGQSVQIILHDGRKLKGVTLGANAGLDSGLVRITEEAEFPYAAMASSDDVEVGQWCIAIGHPNGYQPGRPPVVRVGRVLDVNGQIIRTDCTLVGGDSGGPLFDMAGKVIGVHSRIGGNITFNIHVPVDTYRETWDKLAAGVTWGRNPFDPFGLGGQQGSGAYLGVRAGPDVNAFRIQAVTPQSPADRAGLEADDVIEAIDSREVETPEDLSDVLRNRRPGQQVNVHVRRGGQRLTILVILGRRP